MPFDGRQLIAKHFQINTKKNNPVVVRESAPITTPSSNSTAMIVVYNTWT